MTVSTVASYTPVGGRPQAFAIGSTQTALVVDNQTPNRLELLIGLALLVNVGPNSYSLIPGLSGQTSLVVAPDGLNANPDQRNLSGVLTITSYASGDALPPGALTQSLTMTPLSQQTHYALERLRGGVWANVRDFGALGDGATDDRAAIQAALDVCRVAGGGRVYAPAGVYALGSIGTNSELATVQSCLYMGSGTTLVGDGPSLTTFKQTAGWKKNPLLAGLQPTVELYVSTTGNDNNTGLSRSQALATFNKALSLCTNAGGGYWIHALPGAYTEGQIDTYAQNAAAGTASNPNMIISDVPWAAKLTSTATGATGRAFYMRAGWWVVGLEITGGATAQSGAVMLDGANCACIGCYIHDFSRSIGAAQGGSGVNVTSSAYTATGIIIANNYIYRVGPNNSTQGHGIYANGNGTIVANNLVVFCDGDGIECFHTPSNLVIVGNTIYSCSAGAANGGILLGSGDAGWTVSGCLVANNASVNNTGYGVREFVSGGAAMGTNTITNNLMFGNTIGAFTTPGTDTNANAQTGDPLFVNAQTDGTGDFRVRSGSPCIDNGSDASMPATYGALDFFGFLRPQGTHRDIGYSEYQAYNPPASIMLANYNPTNGNKDLAIEGITFDGGAVNATGLCSPISMIRTNRGRVRGVTVKNYGGRYDLGVNDTPAVHLAFSSQIDISSLMVASDDGGPCGTAVQARYCLDVIVSDFQAISLAQGHGALFDSCNGVKVTSATLAGNGGNGITCYACTDVTLVGIDAGLTAPAVAAYPYTASQNIGNTGHGLYLLATSGKLSNVRSQRNTGDGVWLDGAGTLDLISVQAKNNTGNGVSVNGAVGGGSVRITGARINTNTGHGLYCVTAALATLTRCTDHVISGNSGAQLRIASNSYGVTGSITAPGVPSSTTPLTNPFPFDMTVIITGGTMSLVSVDGSGIGVATSPIYLRIRAGGTVTITYTVAPSWSWYVEN